MIKSIRSEYVVLLFAFFLMVGYNDSLWLGILHARGQFSWSNILFFTTCALFLTALFNLLFSLFALKKVLKPLLIIIVISSAIASYFMDSYGVVIDTSMLQNVFETDTGEVTELLSYGFIQHIVLWGGLPAWVIFKLNIKYSSIVKQLAINIFSVAMSLLVIGLIAAFFYQDYASMFRNHRELRYLINPTDYIYALSKSVTKHFKEDEKLVSITQGVSRGAIAANKQRRTIAVVVVGESARAAEFHLNGYQRETTPMLEKEDVINFSDASSCGTATATSLPCMFSKFSRKDYDYDKDNGYHYENVLDALAASGIKVFWRDNQSGCKGLCDRVDNQRVAHLYIPEYCRDKECFDEDLLQGLDKKIAATDKDMLIVLHQKGSHGPAYYLRVPEQFKKFTPVCQTSEIQNCSNQQIINGYDNTIFYTDHVLSKVIDYLKTLAPKNDTAMIYMSDHGESLGEKNLYLHGTPYFIAPSQQTHIPMVMWLSDSYLKDFHVSRDCLQQKADMPVSHDNLFHSILGMMDVYAPDGYNKKLDLFSLCRITGS